MYNPYCRGFIFIIIVTMRDIETNITVVVRLLWGKAQAITLPKDSTVADFISKAGYSTASDVRYDGNAVPMNARPDDWDELVIMTNKITQG